MPYTCIQPESVIEVRQIINVCSFAFHKDLSFSGHSHGYWETVCVTNGAAEVVAGHTCHTLGTGGIIFHEPYEFHRLTANHSSATDLITVSFYCDSPAMDFFRGKILSINRQEYHLLMRLVHETSHVFQEAPHNPLRTHMHGRPDRQEGAAQVMRLYLELFLLKLFGRFQEKPPATASSRTFPHRTDDETYHRILSYMEENLNTQLTVDQIARDTLTGKSRLQQLVRSRHNCGVIDLFSHLKAEKAKRMIRNSQMNFTEISEALGYSSIHYFSRQFKKLTGHTPSEYAASVQKHSR